MMIITNTLFLFSLGYVLIHAFLDDASAQQQDNMNCAVDIVSPKNGEVIPQLVLLPVLPADPRTFPIDLHFNTTCFHPINITLECISTSCGNDFFSMDYMEVEIYFDIFQNKTYRDMALTFNISYGEYRLRAAHASHTFTVKKIFRFHVAKNYTRHEKGLLKLSASFGRATYWDMDDAAKVFDLLPWTVEIGSFSSFASKSRLHLSHNASIVHDDFITQVSISTQ
jgi:hypothetical protein